jgi:hypothetical protein
MNSQQKPLVSVAPGLYALLVSLRHEDKESLRDLLQCAYYCLPDNPHLTKYAELRGYITGLYHADHIRLSEYLKLQIESADLYGMPRP